MTTLSWPLTLPSLHRVDRLRVGQVSDLDQHCRQLPGLQQEGAGDPLRGAAAGPVRVAPEDGPVPGPADERGAHPVHAQLARRQV